MVAAKETETDLIQKGLAEKDADMLKNPSQHIMNQFPQFCLFCLLLFQHIMQNLQSLVNFFFWFIGYCECFVTLFSFLEIPEVPEEPPHRYPEFHFMIGASEGSLIKLACASPAPSGRVFWIHGDETVSRIITCYSNQNADIQYYCNNSSLIHRMADDK
jgi:hypothetical protein